MMTKWRRPVTQGAILLMEALWGYALVAFFVALTVGGDRPTLPGVLCVVFASFAISRVLRNSAMSEGLLRVWGIVFSLIIFYAIVRVDFYGDWRFWDFTWADALFNNTEATLEDDATAVVGVPVLWLLWMRGISRGQQSLIFEEVVNSFAIGVAIIAVAELFGGAVDAPRMVALVAVPYIAIGLLTIGFAHASRSENEFGRSFAPTWLLAVGGAVALLAGAALLFVLIDFDTARNALGAVSLALTTAIVRSLEFLAWPLEQLFNGLYKFMHFLANLWGGERQEPVQFDEPGQGEDEAEDDTGGGPPGWIRLVSRIIVGGGISAVILVGLYLLFGRYSRRPEGDEVKESTYQDGRLGADLGDMLGSFLNRFRGPGRGGNENEPMRRLYHEVLIAAHDRGVERKAAETPLELAPRLGQTFARETTDSITNAFDDARYGGIAPAPSEVQRLRDEWERNRRP